MIYSQPNQKSLSKEHTLTWKLLANWEAPEAALRKVPRVNIRNTDIPTFYLALMRTFEQKQTKNLARQIDDVRWMEDGRESLLTSPSVKTTSQTAKHKS